MANKEKLFDTEDVAFFEKDLKVADKKKGGTIRSR